jgi:hypothetical protein
MDRSDPASAGGVPTGRLVLLLGVLAVAAAMLPNAASSKAPLYRVCARSLGGQRATVRARSAITCPHAVAVATRGDHADGDDGERFRYLNREWQCVTIARPDRGQQTEFGCFTLRAKEGVDYVTFLIFSPAD